MGFQDNLPPAMTANLIAASLHMKNRIHIRILDLFGWNTYYLFWTLDGGSENTTRITDRASDDGTVDHDFTSEPNGHYTFQVQGCPVRADGPARPDDGHCSPRSEIVTVTAAANQSSVREFLQNSGSDPTSNGLRFYGVGSIRGLLNGD
jgi:hypothetical protein